ncbi:porin family protein [Halocola ammonii]
MKNILLALTILISSTAFSQDHFFGLTGGPNVTDVIHNDFLESTDYEFGFTAGFNYQYRLNENITIGADLLYEKRGFNSVVLYSREDEFNSVYSLTVFDFHYVTLPIKAGYRLNVTDKLYGFGNLGVAPGYLIKTEFDIPELFSYNGGEPITANKTEEANRIDLAGLAELGAGYQISDNILCYVLAKYQYSILSVSDTEYFERSDIHHHGISLMAGVSFRLFQGDSDSEE